MMGQMDEMMLHVTTSFNICNSLNPVPNAQVRVYLTVCITKLVNNKKEKRTLPVLLGRLKKKCLNKTPKQICLKLKIENYITSILKNFKIYIDILLIFLAT
jgi:hypothetical protein